MHGSPQDAIEMMLDMFRRPGTPNAVRLLASDAPMVPSQEGDTMTMPFPFEVWSEFRDHLRKLASIECNSTFGEIILTHKDVEADEREEAMRTGIKARNMEQFFDPLLEDVLEVRRDVSVRLEIAESESPPVLILRRLDS